MSELNQKVNVEWKSASGLPVVGTFFEGEITSSILSELYPLLQHPFTDDCVQRTKKEDTKKKYDTTGIGYQFAVNRMNEVLGPSYWRYIQTIIKEEPGTWGNPPKPNVAISVETVVQIGNWINGTFVPIYSASSVGGHKGEEFYDVLKGAETNSLKKTLAFIGVGRQSYEGTLDEDADSIEAPNKGTTKSQGTTTTQPGKRTSGTTSSSTNPSANAATNNPPANPPANKPPAGNQTGGTSGSIFSGQIILTSNPVKQGAKKAAVKGVLIDEDKECEVCGWASDGMIDEIMGLGSGQVIEVNGAKRQYSTQYGLQLTLKKESYKIAS